MSATMTKDPTRTKDRADGRRRIERDGRSERKSTGPRRTPDVTVRLGNGRKAIPKSPRHKATMRVASRPKSASVPQAQPTKSRVFGRPGPGWLSSFFESQTIEKSLVLFSWAIALILIVPFGCDLICGSPFHRASTLFDAASFVCGLGLAYLSWNTSRNFR